MGVTESRRARRYLWYLVPLAALLVLALVWIGWAERHPGQERELRVRVQQELEARFPEAMTLPDDRRGFIPRGTAANDGGQPDVVLLHGLDEPGGIWDELVPVLDDAGIVAWEFRYPNDQAIDHSADLLGDYWSELDPDQQVVLVGHSMGGLVARDFVSRLRHPVDTSPPVAGAGVRGLIQVATPNHGSDWARLRVWLQLRELLASIPEGEFSLFAGLRDGTGAAKIDLRPGSDFLTELNARAWPGHVPVKIIGGMLTEPLPALEDDIEAVAGELDADELADALEAWWSEVGQGLGDGAVPLTSLPLPEAPPPTVVAGSHRGLLVQTPMSDGQPPAIDPVLETLEQWLEPRD